MLERYFSLTQAGAVSR